MRDTEPVRLSEDDARDAAKAITDVLAEIGSERARQIAKFGQQDHPDGTGGMACGILAFLARTACEAATKAGTLTWIDVLREETEEVSAEKDPAKLRAELVQVAAVCAAWIESIDRRMPRPSLTGKESNT